MGNRAMVGCFARSFLSPTMRTIQPSAQPRRKDGMVGPPPYVYRAAQPSIQAPGPGRPIKETNVTCDYPWSGCASNFTHLAAGDYPCPGCASNFAHQKAKADPLA